MRRGGLRRRLVRGLRAAPALLFSLAFLFYEELPVAVVTLAAILLHECGHLLAFSLLREPPPSFSSALGGFRLTAARPLSYRRELAVCAAGPGANLLAALLLLPLCRLGVGGGYAPLCLAVMLATAAANLLPIGDLDGGRMLYASLAARLPLETAERIASGVSVATAALGLFLSLAVLSETGALLYTSLFFLCFLLSFS